MDSKKRKKSSGVRRVSERGRWLLCHFFKYRRLVGVWIFIRIFFLSIELI